MRTLSTVALLVLLWAVPEGPTAEAAEKQTVACGRLIIDQPPCKIMPKVAIGCLEEDRFRQLMGLDEAAFQKAVVRFVMSGECTVFEEGEDVYLAELAGLSSVVRIRRVGEIDSYWASRSTLWP